MAKQFEIYKCEECGNMVEVLAAGKCEPACCGKTMKLFAENSTDAAQEKHVPVVEKTADGYKVTIGSVPHPMEEKHFIQWIELLADGISYTQFLKPGAKAEAFFPVKASQATAREYCNLHGLWKK
jgi:superoxide reductase